MIWTIYNTLVRVTLSDTAERVVISGLKKYLSCKLEGASHSTLCKTGKWDGMVSFFKYNTFPTGFLEAAYKHCKENYTVDIDLIDNRQNLPLFKSEISNNVGDDTLRDYQVDAVKSVNKYILGNMYFPRGVINAATNAGKTHIIAGIHANVVDPKMLYIIHSKSIFDQVYKDFKNHFGFDVGRIDANNFYLGEITIAMFQTIASKLRKQDQQEVKDFFSGVNILIVDECHRAGSNGYMQVTSIIDAGMRVFVSGTALKNKDKVKNLAIIGSSGPVLYKVTNKDLIDEGVSRKPTINVHYIYQPLKANTILDYNIEAEKRIYLSEVRMAKIQEIVKNNYGKYTLISVEKLAHGRHLQEQLQKEYPDLNIAFTYSEDPLRQSSLDAFKSGELHILISTMILKEGVNIPNIDVLILAHGGRSNITVVQLIGRALRAKKGHDTVEIHDFYDEGFYVKRHSKQRLNIYRAEKFTINPDYNYHPKTFYPK